ncbi:MAG TPA: hypothetical protein VHX65_00100 [Pirellulales bacterium]|jgi:hypothetical protein|nr:hypothetical protein [Pirellulales bacterium]
METDKKSPNPDSHSANPDRRAPGSAAHSPHPKTDPKSDLKTNPNAVVPRPAVRAAAARDSNAAASAPLWAKLLNPKYLAVAAAVVIAINLGAFYFLRVRAPAPKPAKPNLQMVLGAFEYNRVNPRDKQLKHGQFTVTLHLAKKLDPARFREIHDREKDLQAAIEDSMRLTRASDFADPRFIRLKSRFQERLNEELGFDGIDEVMVANVPEPAMQAADPQDAGADANGAAETAPDPSTTGAAAPNAAGK